MRTVIAIALLICTFSIAPAQAELVLSGVGVEVIENFDDYRGTGFAPNPTAGQLDSDTYRAIGFSDGDMTFGGTYASGDFARGTSTGGVSTGGAYSFDVGGGDYALGVQPTGDDFNPGNLTIKVKNDTGVELNYLRITADAMIYNDADRSTTWTFGGAMIDNDAAYGDFQTLTSPQAADTSPTWESTPVGGLIDLSVFGNNLAVGGDFFIRVSGIDNAMNPGSGSRDEFALNNLSITGYVTAIPEPSSLAFCMFGVIPFAIARRRRNH